MNHKIYILTNGNLEAYIMIRQAHFTLDFLVDKAFGKNKHWDKKNPVLNRFISENINSIEMEKLDLPENLGDLKSVIEYRNRVTQEYHENGYLVLDEKYYDLMDSPADKNFGEVLKAIDIKQATQKFGTKVLIEARKKLSVGEFIAQYG